MRCKQTSERTSTDPSTLCVNFVLFVPKVQRADSGRNDRPLRKQWSSGSLQGVAIKEEESTDEGFKIDEAIPETDEDALSAFSEWLLESSDLTTDLECSFCSRCSTFDGDCSSGSTGRETEADDLYNWGGSRPPPPLHRGQSCPQHPKRVVDEIDGFLQRLESLHARSEKCRESLARIEVDFETLAPRGGRAIYCSMDSDEVSKLKS